MPYEPWDEKTQTAFLQRDAMLTQQSGKLKAFLAVFFPEFLSEDKDFADTAIAVIRSFKPDLPGFHEMNIPPCPDEDAA